MPALSFQRQFAEKVRRGEKVQTIRAARRHPIREGDRLYLYTGMRTKSCEKLGESVCALVATVDIRWSGVCIDGVLLSSADADTLARKDGFTGFVAMASWFAETHTLPFFGQLICWNWIDTEPQDRSE